MQEHSTDKSSVGSLDLISQSLHFLELILCGAVEAMENLNKAETELMRDI